MTCIIMRLNSRRSYAARADLIKTDRRLAKQIVLCLNFRCFWEGMLIFKTIAVDNRLRLTESSFSPNISLRFQLKANMSHIPD